MAPDTEDDLGKSVHSIPNARSLSDNRLGSHDLWVTWPPRQGDPKDDEPEPPNILGGSSAERAPNGFVGTFPDSVCVLSMPLLFAPATKRRLKLGSV